MAAVLLLLSASLASVAAQCGSANMARCSIWINNGFCTNTAYNVLIRQASCPTMCKMGCPNTPSTAREACLGDGNANCAAWSTNAANPFCLSTTMTAASKFIYCCRTCAAEITPQGDCLIYNNARTRVSSLTNNAAIQTIPTGNTLFRAFVRTGCRLRLFAEATAVPATATPLQTITGSQMFQEVQTAAAAALGVVCSCP